MKDTVRIYTAFTSSGLSSSSQTYSLHHPDRPVLSNERILDELHKRCTGVEFVGGPQVQRREYTIANVRGGRPGLDGVLYFGTLADELATLDLPLLAVYPLWGQWQAPFNAQPADRALTATLPVIPDASAERFSARLDDIAEKIRLLQVVARMNALRILCVTDVPVLGMYEPTPQQIGWEGRETYEKTYLTNLGALGAEMVVRPQDELVRRTAAASEAEAADVSRRWIAESKDVRGTNESEIQRSARVYLAMRDMMTTYGANAITTEGYGVWMKYPGGPIPSQGLPSSQFCADGVVATSETLMDSLLTQQLGLGATGATGFNGDYVVDPPNHKAYIGHCECPWTPYGDDRRVPYVIRNLPQWPADQQETGGACVQVELPANEVVTVVKLSVHEKKMAVFTGTAVPGEDLFPGWADILCRTKLAVDADADRLLENLDWTTFGNHRVAFYGDHRQRFMNLARLLGYQAIEKDQ